MTSTPLVTMNIPTEANAFIPYLTRRDRCGIGFGGSEEAYRAWTRREVGVCRVRRGILGNVFGSAVLRLFVCNDRGCLNALDLGLTACLRLDAMMLRVWPATARGIGNIFEARSQRIGREGGVSGGFRRGI